MNGVGITKIDDKFFKAVPATNMNVHVPIWLEGPASSLSQVSEFIFKMFHLKYSPANEVREQLNPFSTPNVEVFLFSKKQIVFCH